MEKAGRAVVFIAALSSICMTSVNADPMNVFEGSTAQSSPAAKPLRHTEVFYFDDWTVICQEFADASAERSCSAQLQAQQSETNRTVVVWAVKINGQKVNATLQTLTGVMLAPGADLQPENSEVRKFAFETCDTNGCVASATLDDKFLHDATKSSKATVTLHGTAGNTIRFEIPMKGFDRAFAQLKATK
jgi:invasion protein IalB